MKSENEASNADVYVHPGTPAPQSYDVHLFLPESILHAHIYVLQKLQKEARICPRHQDALNKLLRLERGGCPHREELRRILGDFGLFERCLDCS